MMTGDQYRASLNDGRGGLRSLLRMHYDIENAKRMALQYAHMGEYIE